MHVCDVDRFFPLDQLRSPHYGKGSRVLTVPPWTYGFISDDENCPSKAWHKHVKKDLPREEKAPAQVWGIDVHKGLERRLKERESLPANMERWERFAMVIEKAKAEGATVLIEESLAIDSTGRMTNFFGNDVWGRSRIDIGLLWGTSAAIFDWKTGKPNEDPLELELQALLLKCAYPNLTYIVGHYVWLKEDRIGPRHDLSNFGRTMNDVRLRMKDVESRDIEKEWAKKPNPLCPWCPVFSCEHNRNPSKK